MLAINFLKAINLLLPGKFDPLLACQYTNWFVVQYACEQSPGEWSGHIIM